METATLEYLECFEHVIDSTADIDLLWGGRDSGKSHEIARQVVVKMLEHDYFRCILIKKTYESIKDAQWQTVKDIVYDAGLQEFFKFTQSPLEISSTINDNKCIARGCDKPEKLKSISNPSHAWFEEGNQLTQDDYHTVTTTLRSNKARVKEWFSFNPESVGDYKDFWLYKDFFSVVRDPYENFTHTKTIKVGEEEASITYTSTHTTYNDNPYCTAERKARHEDLKTTNPFRYRVFTLGQWGNRENTNKWAWALSREKHYNPKPFELLKNVPLDLSFDFNHSPVTVVVGQKELSRPYSHIIGYHKASSGEVSGIEGLCKIIEREYLSEVTRYNIRVTGDASGTHKDAGRPAMTTYYTKVCDHLNIGRNVITLPKANTTHKASAELCNDALHKIPKGFYTFWGGRGCEMLLSEIESAYPDHKESLDKAKKELGLHGLDGWRYLNRFWYSMTQRGDKFLVGGDFHKYQAEIKEIVRRIKRLSK